jgi:hypothetical protein
MKKRILAAAAAASLAGTIHAAGRVEDSKTWTDSFPVTATQPTLKIENIWGDVTVRPGKTGEISVRVRETRSAPDQDRFDRSQETLRLNTEVDENGVAFYVGNRSRYWHGSDNCRGCRLDVRFEVTVPPDTKLDVSTVNDGRVDIDGISGHVSAANVNGPIAVNGLRNCDEMNSVNGDVSLGFSASPAADCRIETINGDITLVLPDDSGLDVAMDLFNGRMLTQLPVGALALPATVEHIESDGQHKYRIEQQAGVRIGAGGPKFTISSMNGDIRIQKIN